MLPVHRSILSFLKSSCLILGIVSSAAAQDSLLTVQKRPWFNGIRMGMDLFSLGKAFYQNTFPQYDLTADLGIKRFFLEVNYGYNTSLIKGDNYEYESKGSYTRIGVAYNLIKERTAKNVIFVGVRGCWADFGDKTHFTIQSKQWGSHDEEIQRERVHHRWAELAAGVRVYIWKNIYLGYGIQYKIRLQLDQSDHLEAYYTPGYGLNDKKSISFTYHLLYRIPFVKTK